MLNVVNNVKQINNKTEYLINNNSQCLSIIKKYVKSNIF